MGILRWLGRHGVVLSIVGVVLVGVGAEVRPHVQKWWELRSLCDGGLSRGLVDAARGEQPLDHQSVRHDPALGRYGCTLSSEDDRGRRTPVVSVTAATAPDTVDTRLIRAFGLLPASVVTTALPEDLPGLLNRNLLGGEHEAAELHLVRECPSLGSDFRGRDQRMLVTLSAVLTDYDALVRLAVEAANAASTELGCGADPLEPPARPVPEPQAEQLAHAGESHCAPLSADALEPPSEGGWLVSEGVTGELPVGRCVLGTGTHAALEFQVWHGGVSDALSTDSMMLPHAEGDLPLAELWLPRIDGTGGFATARCGPESAVFVYRFHPEGYGSEFLDAETAAEPLAAFATGEAERRGCTDVRLPEVPDEDG